MRLALLLAAAVILIGDPTGKWAGDSLKPWFDSLRNKLGLYCCAEAVGHPLDDLSGTSRTIASAFFVQGEWTIVPDDAVLLGPNKFVRSSFLTSPFSSTELYRLPVMFPIPLARRHDMTTLPHLSLL